MIADKPSDKELGNRNYFHKYDVGRLKNMLGNLKDGDGYKYRGRGLIQITGRANYQAYQNSEHCTGDIMEHPELLEKPLGLLSYRYYYPSFYPQRQCAFSHHLP
jgi:putative chitinase